MAVVLIGLAHSARAQTTAWQNTGSDWNTSGNWSSGLPGAATGANFNTASTVNPNISSSTSVLRLTFSSAGSIGYTVSSSGGASLTLLGTGVGTSAALNTSGNGTNTISAPVIFGAAADSTQVINLNTASSVLQITGPISSTNSINLNITGNSSSLLVLSNSSNSYTGTTTLSAGTVEFANGALGASNVRFGGSTLRYASGNSQDISSRIVGSASAVRVQPNGNDVTYASSIGASNTGGMVVIGTGGGSLTLSASNSYLGTTALGTNARLNIQDVNALSSGALVFSGNASFDNTSASALTVSNALTLNANATFIGTQALTMNGTVSLSGGNRSITVSNTNATLTLNGNIDNAENRNLTKLGAGTLVLSGSSSHTGSTIVSLGTLVVNGSVNSSAATVNNGGTLAGIGSVSSVTLNAGGHIAPGSAAGTIGTLSTANGNFTWNGEDTAVAQMTFNLSNTANMGLTASSDRISLGLGAFNQGTGGFFEFDFGNSGAHGNTYTLVTFGSQTGFDTSDFSYTGLASGLTGTFNITADSLQFVVVPEPSTLALVGLAIAACFGGWRRRRSSLHF